MKWTTIPINLPSFSDLVQQALEFLRGDLVTVNKTPLSKGKYIDRSIKRPWHIIPSIKGFSIELSPFDWLLELFNLKKRFPNRFTFDTWLNDEANAYLDYMFKRLTKQVELKKYKEATETVWKLMNSSAYQTSALNHVLKNWHRKLPEKLVKRVLKNVVKLARKRATTIQYSRVYKDEASKVRPLGVPTMPWRIYLHMYNNCLVQWRLVSEGNKQHGYLPGKGVMTAWFELSKKLNQPNIYEADFKGFFDNVKHNAILVESKKLGIPHAEALFIWALNNSVVQLQEVDRIDEPHRKHTIDPKGTQAWILGKTGRVMTAPTLRGVPQGAPTSCSVATLALRRLESLYDILFYADDVFYFPDSSTRDPIEDLTDKRYGLIVNEKKSRWLKKDGIWLVESFKFLGIRYYPGSLRKTWINNWGGLNLIGLIPQSLTHKPSRFIAETRNGANLEFTNRESLLSYLAIAREILLDTPYLRKATRNWTLQHWIQTREAKWALIKNKANMLFAEAKVQVPDTQPTGIGSALLTGKIPQPISRIYRNPLTGYFLARMFSNTWDINIPQDFGMRAIGTSWVEREWNRYSLEWLIPRNRLTIFNASSFASHDIMEWLSKKDSIRAKAKTKIRRVYTKTKPKRSERWKTVIRKLTNYRDEFLRDNRVETTWTATKSSPKWEFRRRHPNFADLILTFSVDCALGVPVFTVWLLWTYLRLRKEYFEI